MASQNLIKRPLLALKSFQRVNSGSFRKNINSFTKAPSRIQSGTSCNYLGQPRFYHGALIIQEPQVVKVPSMGDSITEGTIIEWEKKVGDAVSEGDVVALIETDKVTVDIKAEMDGVITALYGGVDDTVEVGSKLYQIDADAAAAESSGAESSNAEASTSESEETVSPKVATESTTKSSSSSFGLSTHRTPSIHFLGKDGWAALRRGETEHADNVVSSSLESAEHFEVIQSLVPEDPSWDPMYGRPPIIEDEIDALILGGAEGTDVPQLIKPSRGAIFA